MQSINITNCPLCDRKLITYPQELLCNNGNHFRYFDMPHPEWGIQFLVGSETYYANFYKLSNLFTLSTDSIVKIDICKDDFVEMVNNGTLSKIENYINFI